MARQINFLADRQKKVSSQQIADAKSLRLGLTVFGVVLAVFLLVFGVRLFSQIQLRQIDAAKQVALSKITQGEDTERLYLIFFQKVKALSDLYNERQDKQKAVLYMSTIFQPYGLVTGIEFNQQDKVLTFEIQSDDVFNLQQIFTVLKQDTLASQFSAVNASNLQRSEDGKYSVQVTVSTKTGFANLPQPTPILPESPASVVGNQ